MTGLPDDTNGRSRALAVGTVFVCFLLHTMGRGLSDSFTVFLISLEGEFAWTRAQLSGVYSTTMLGFAVGAPIAGMVFDRFGPRELYGAGTATLAVGLLLASGSDQLWHLYAYIGIPSGVALAALGMIPASNILSRLFKARLSLAIAVVFAGVGAGSLLVVPLAQVLIDAVGWRQAYRTLGLGTLAITLVVFALPWQRVAATTAMSRSKRPAVLPHLIDALRRPVFWGLAAVYFFTSISAYAIILQTIAYLISVGLTPLHAAGVFGAVGMLSVGGMIGSGMLAVTVPIPVVGCVSYVLSLCGVAALASLAGGFHPALLWAYVGFFGLSQGSRGPLVATLSARIFRGGAPGAVYGTITTCNGLGGALGAWAGGLLHDLTGGYAGGFVLAAAALVCACVPFVVVKGFRQR